MKRTIFIKIYTVHEHLREAVNLLKYEKFDLKKLSVVGRDFHCLEKTGGFYQYRYRPKYVGELGAFWTELWDTLCYAAFFYVHDIGPVIIGGALVRYISDKLAKKGGSPMDVVREMLYLEGVPAEDAKVFEKCLKENKFLLVVHGTVKEIELVEQKIGKIDLSFY